MVENITPVKEKSKLLAFLLGLFLGFIGIHNIYLGRWKRGLFQFFFVVFTLGAGLIITLPWAGIETLLILVGKYSLGPKRLEKTDLDQEIINSQKLEVSSKKEYLIAILLLSPFLVMSFSVGGIPLLFAVVFYFIRGGLWNKITRLFIKLILPIYATIFSGREKFLIRFSEYTIPVTGTRPELFRAVRKLSVTAILVLLFVISLIAQSNMSMVTGGEIPGAVICDDGTFEMNGFCDDESSGRVCDSSCVMDNTSANNRILEAYGDKRIILSAIFAPLITVLVAPILVLNHSSLSIVDKKTRSISPIGQKANDLTNVGAGFGSIVIFFQTAWKISSAATENGEIMQGIGFVALILSFTLFLVLCFYPLIWFPMLKFTKSFELHVLLLDNSLVESKGIEVHQLSYDHNELRITPADKTQEVDAKFAETPVIDSPNYQSEENKVITSGPPIHTNPQSSDQHGFEWVNHNGKNFYRPIGQVIDWKEFHN
jgi:TM2 domain-containing membrane protein YozV